MFANVLRDSLGASSDASMFWLPRSDLSALLPDAVERFLAAHGGGVARGTRVDAVAREGTGFRLRRRDRVTATERFDAVVYAAPPHSCASVARALAPSSPRSWTTIARFAYEPICTCLPEVRRADVSDRPRFHGAARRRRPGVPTANGPSTAAR
jgi:hydroxysqualene dehydroxylase